MTNQAIGLALTKIAALLGAFGSQLMGRPIDLDNASVLRTMQDIHNVKAQPAAAKAAAPQPKPTTQPKAVPAKLSKRHMTIVMKFRKAGIKDPKLFIDIKTPALWAADGLRPRKGTKSIHGLFHRSQVQAIA